MLTPTRARAKVAYADVLTPTLTPTHTRTQAEGRERGLLVKKWTSVVRLSKQLQDLKAKLAAAESSSYSKHWAGAART